MIGLRPFLLRSVAAIGQGGLDDVARFWAAVEWNAYLRRATMLSVCVGNEPMESPQVRMIRTEIPDRDVLMDANHIATSSAVHPVMVDAMLTEERASEREVFPAMSRDAPPPPESWE